MRDEYSCLFAATHKDFEVLKVFLWYAALQIHTSELTICELYGISRTGMEVRDVGLWLRMPIEERLWIAKNIRIDPWSTCLKRSLIWPLKRVLYHVFRNQQYQWWDKFFGEEENHQVGCWNGSFPCQKPPLVSSIRSRTAHVSCSISTIHSAIFSI